MRLVGVECRNLRVEHDPRWLGSAEYLVEAGVRQAAQDAATMLAVVGTQDPMLRDGARDDAARTDTRYDPVLRDDTRWAVADIAIGLVGHIRVEVHKVAKSVGFDAHGNVVFCPRPAAYTHLTLPTTYSV